MRTADKNQISDINPCGHGKKPSDLTIALYFLNFLSNSEKQERPKHWEDKTA